MRTKDLVVGIPRAFSLLELLVVMAIISTLAALSLAGIAMVKQRAKIMEARQEMINLKLDIEEYQRVYNNRLPVSDKVIHTSVNGVSLGPRDFTFGTESGNNGGVLSDGKGQPLPLIRNMFTGFTIRGDPVNGYLPYDYQANNSEVISILYDIQTFPINGQPTVNAQHRYNPNKHAPSSLLKSSGTRSHGIGDDLVFRDPWGNPYIITFDLDGDGRSLDAFYGMATVSEFNAPANEVSTGFNSLVRGAPLPPLKSGGPNANFPNYLYPPNVHPTDRDGFKAHTGISIWSFGPDGKANTNPNNSASQKADEGDNKDNLLSWK